jgi:hypothetical protein
MGSNNYFLDFFNKWALGTQKRDCAEFAPFWIKITMYCSYPPEKELNEQMAHFSRVSNGSKYFLFIFFLIKGFLGPLRGAGQSF